MNLFQVILTAYSLAITAQAQNVNTFWNDYPACERQCHQTVFGNQSCSLANTCSCSPCLCLADSCLCETSSWLIAVTQCVGQVCGVAAVSEAAAIANSACNSNGFPLAVNAQSLISIGLAAVPTTTTAASSTSTTQAPTSQTSSSTTSTPSSQATSSSGSTLSSAVTAVIAVLATLVVVGIVAGYLFWRYMKNKRRRQERAAQEAIQAQALLGPPPYVDAGWVDIIELPDRPGQRPPIELADRNLSPTELAVKKY